MIVNADSIEWIKNNLATNSIDIIVTSPPYKTVDGWNENLIINSAREWFRILKDNSLLFFNFGHLAEDKFRPFRSCQLLINEGFKLNDTITWIKNHYRPIQGNKRLNNLSEFIFLLYKGKMSNLDRLSVGIPYVDKSNVNRFSGGRDLKCRGNIWHINYDTINKSEEKLHNDRFPLELPLTCLKLSGLKNGTVLDPFAGSFTTCLAAKKLGLDFIGIEKDIKYISIGKNRLS